MQTLQISDQAAQQLKNMADQERTTTEELVEKLILIHAEELTRQRELKAFFLSHQKDLTGFKFDREESNAR